MGYEVKTPNASKAFLAPEINNDFVNNLKNEKNLSAEIGYQLDCSWLHANINAYYYNMTDVTEWQQFYFDYLNENIYNSFTHVSLTNVKKEPTA